MRISEETGNLLVVGGPCILSVDCVNRPTGLWWGTIKTKEKKEDHYEITACITGGKFQFQKEIYSSYLDITRPIYSNEFKDSFPVINYTIYPDLHFIRSLLFHQEELKNIIHDLRLNFSLEKKLLFDIIANIKTNLAKETEEKKEKKE